MEKRKTIEEYERLAHDLAEQRDAKSDVAARLATENKVLRDELKPMLERLAALLGASDRVEARTAKMMDDALEAIVAGAKLAELTPLVGVQDLIDLPESLSKVYALIYELRGALQALQKKRYRNVRPATAKKKRRR